MKRKLLIAFLAVCVLGLAGFAWLWFAPCGMGGCAPVSELEKFQAEGSELLDVNGKPFGTLATVNRRIVPLDSLPDFLPRAFLAVEDRRFFDHGGVDWKRFAGALVTNVKRGGVAEGGSTITMQLARNLFPEHLPYRERSLRRKVMEIRVARQIERAFDKRKILELYLNHIYLGERAYGVEAASRVYFGKPASQLTLAEAAVLGGLPVSPSRINPRQDREAARERRDLVLREMAKAGYVPAAEAEAALRQPLRLARRDPKAGAQRHGWFVERVRQELEERVGERLYTAGLRVYTTLDPVAQRAAEQEVARQADAIEAGAFGAFRHPTYPEAKGETEDGNTPYLQAMAIVMDARTGAVRALVGGRDFEDSKFDRAFQALRQPGSAFKPFVYLAALQRGIPPTERIEDAPVKLVLAGGGTWEPRNYTGTYDGPLTVRDALTRSKNTVTVRLSQQVGMSAVLGAARELGVASKIAATPATALGASEVRPVELVRAYAAFANGGDRVEPHFVRRVEDRDGAVLWEADTQPVEVLDPAEAYVLTTMLRDVVDRGTGTPVRAAGFRGPAAGKTGTTNAATDVWFVGYTPELVGAVWFGLDQPATIVRGASGGTIAAPVWGRIMRRVYAGRPVPDFRMPRGVVTETIDRATGFPVDAGCRARGPTYTEYFVHVRPPRPYCYPDPTTYPAYAAYDSAWYDEEVSLDGYEPGAYDPDTVGLTDLQRRGIDWPELEELRRRRAGGEEVPPPASSPADRRARVSDEPPPPPPAARGGGEDTVPAPPSSRPAPRREPRVLGKPVTPPPSEPPPPVPPDTSGTGG